MKKNIGVWQFSGLAIIFSLGSLFHFLYEWTNLTFFALFCSVNESTWEHMKILFFPSLFFAIFQSFYFKEEYSNFWTIKLTGTLISLTLIPVLFYTLTGIFGTLKGYVNILIFFLSIVLGLLYEAKQFKTNNCHKKPKFPSKTLFFIIAVLFASFTFYPPKIPLFLDPIYKTYGII